MLKWIAIGWGLNVVGCFIPRLFEKYVLKQKRQSSDGMEGQGYVVLGAISLIPYLTFCLSILALIPITLISRNQK